MVGLTLPENSNSHVENAPSSNSELELFALSIFLDGFDIMNLLFFTTKDFKPDKIY